MLIRARRPLAAGLIILPEQRFTARCLKLSKILAYVTRFAIQSLGTGLRSPVCIRSPRRTPGMATAAWPPCCGRKAGRWASARSSACVGSKVCACPRPSGRSPGGVTRRACRPRPRIGACLDLGLHPLSAALRRPLQPCRNQIVVTVGIRSSLTTAALLPAVPTPVGLRPPSVGPASTTTDKSTHNNIPD